MIIAEMLKRGRKILAPAAWAVAAMLAASLVWKAQSQPPRPWDVKDVPVAFWAWKMAAPDAKDVERAIERAGAKALFQRAGQIDFQNGRLTRIRELKGVFPTGVEIHLVYHGTRSLLAGFGRLEPAALADLIAETYLKDASRASVEGARVAGVQLDLDSPTRLLGHFARILKATRARLPSGAKLSITGLPTWMDSPDIAKVLAEVDFWTPQCYGAVIPERLDLSVPITSPQIVAQTIDRVRSLNHPFYAGLAAYGYAIHYSRNGAMAVLRGDLDPALVAADSNFELVERRPFDTPGEWRYVYRARGDWAIDGLAVRAGEYLLFDMPTREGLRACARAVRERAGEKLLGVCLFRLPTGDDPTTLTIEEIASALADLGPTFAADVKVEGFNSTIEIAVTNKGSARPLMGKGGMEVEVIIPTGKLRGVRLDGFADVETLCVSQPCAMRRANRLSLGASAWPPGVTARASIELEGEPPEFLSLAISVNADDGRSFHDELAVSIKKGREE